MGWFLGKYILKHVDDDKVKQMIDKKIDSIKRFLQKSFILKDKIKS